MSTDSLPGGTPTAAELPPDRRDLPRRPLDPAFDGDPPWFDAEIAHWQLPGSRRLAGDHDTKTRDVLPQESGEGPLASGSGTGTERRKLLIMRVSPGVVGSVVPNANVLSVPEILRMRPARAKKCQWRRLALGT